MITCSNDLYINHEGETIEKRFLVPEGYEREKYDSSSFAFYLRNLPLKPHNTLVKYFNGKEKPNINIYEAVLDLEIGKRDLHQCADAVMRLRAEFLYNQKKYKDIHFNFTNGFRVDYSKWMEGYRIKVDGNKVSWVKSASPGNSYESFWKYMEIIFSYAGTLSLSKELKSVDIKDMAIGDVFIKGGSPGHAVIVVDMAIDSKTGKKVFLLAQSYMPAQEIQVLKNPMNSDLSPWYELEFSGDLKTPEWTFKPLELKRF